MCFSAYSAPLLLKPIRLMIALSSSSRNSRGFGFPDCGLGVMVPTSIPPNPCFNSVGMHSAFLSNPAASPTGFRTFMPAIFVSSAGCFITGEVGRRLCLIAVMARL